MTNIINVGTKSMVDAVHLAAARAVMITHPQLQMEPTQAEDRSFNVLVGEFKEEHYFLDYEKLVTLVRTLRVIHSKMFSSFEVKSPLSVLGTDESLESVMDIAAAEMAVFKEASEYFNANCRHERAEKAVAVRS